MCQEGKIATVVTAMRQVGVGSQGAEALAIFHQVSFGEWMAGSLKTHSARIKVVETTCFGMIEWNAVRISESSFLPKLAAVAGWKHRALSFGGTSSGRASVERSRWAVLQSVPLSLGDCGGSDTVTRCWEQTAGIVGTHSNENVQCRHITAQFVVFPTLSQCSLCLCLCTLSMSICSYQCDIDDWTCVLWLKTHPKSAHSRSHPVVRQDNFCNRYPTW